MVQLIELEGQGIMPIGKTFSWIAIIIQYVEKLLKISKILILFLQFDTLNYIEQKIAKNLQTVTGNEFIVIFL
jgi:hypothetical protein